MTAHGSTLAVPPHRPCPAATYRVPLGQVLGQFARYAAVPLPPFCGRGPLLQLSPLRLELLHPLHQHHLLPQRSLELCTDGLDRSLQSVTGPPQLLQLPSAQDENQSGVKPQLGLLAV